nr:MAG TPA: hypothetical protein [Bacteriophage sp.]
MISKMLVSILRSTLKVMSQSLSKTFSFLG